MQSSQPSQRGDEGAGSLWPTCLQQLQQLGQGEVDNRGAARWRCRHDDGAFTVLLRRLHALHERPACRCRRHQCCDGACLHLRAGQPSISIAMLAGLSWQRGCIQAWTLLLGSTHRNLMRHEGQP